MKTPAALDGASPRPHHAAMLPRPAADARPELSPRLWLASLAFWTLFGALSALQIQMRESGDVLSAPFRDVFNIVYFYWAWALVTPFVLRIAERAARSEHRWTRRVAEQIPAAAAVIVVQSALYALFSAVDGRVPFSAVPAVTAKSFVRHLAGDVLTYASIVGAWLAWEQARRSREREREAARLTLRASELESLVARAKLEALEAQLQPHFLFNTLNLISTLVVRGDAAAADRAIARLGALLRASLSSSAGQLVMLGEELELARQYLEIARLRFGDRLAVVERVSNDALGVMVPTLILQPLIENAIEHGIAKRARGGLLELTAEDAEGPEGRVVVITVRDDGPGFGDVAVGDGGGVGLANVRARLAHLYGNATRLETTNAPGGGAVVTLRIPARGVAPAWSPAAGARDAVRAG